MDNYYHSDTQMDTLVLLKDLFTSLETCEELERNQPQNTGTGRNGRQRFPGTVPDLAGDAV